VGAQSSRLAVFGGLGMSFNICRGPLGSLAMIGQEAIQRAQRGVANRDQAIFAGPNLDFITGEVGRWDGCHLSTNGLKAAAAQWKHYLLQALRSSSANIENHSSGGVFAGK